MLLNVLLISPGSTTTYLRLSLVVAVARIQDRRFVILDVKILGKLLAGRPYNQGENIDAYLKGASHIVNNILCGYYGANSNMSQAAVDFEALRQRRGNFGASRHLFEILVYEWPGFQLQKYIKDEQNDVINSYWNTCSGPSPSRRASLFATDLQPGTPHARSPRKRAL